MRRMKHFCFFGKSSSVRYSVLFFLSFSLALLLKPSKGFSMMAEGAPTRPITWAIAGSDSGGGAGIQADLHAFQTLGTHGCSVVTALTAQNSKAVTHIQYASEENLRASLAALDEDLPAKAIKLGMLGTESVINVVAEYLEGLGGPGAGPPVVVDPVMISTSGSRLLDAAAEAALVARIFPRAAVLTPNRHEAQALLGGPAAAPLGDAADVERAALRLLALGPRSVLLKGGHLHEGGPWAQDYWTDGTRSMWLTSPRADHPNTHGTGCTMSSAIAACMAQGFDIEDAVTIAKAYITQGLGAAARLGSGPGPVAHTSWPCDPGALPWATSTAARGQHRPEFPPCQAPEEWGLYPIVDSADWVERLVLMGVKDIQIRIKDKGDDEIMEAVGRAQAACSAAGARLWVNDHWRAAVRHKTYGCHLGQEDLMENLEGIDELSAAGIRLGLSTHCYSELARAVAVRPSYVSLGPIYQTFSKQVRFAPRGLENLKQWRKLVDVPLIAIGGITYENAPKVIEAGADSIAVISAITKENDVQAAIDMWNKVFLSP